MKNSKYEKILMKYYVDIIYMIVNGVIISNDKNKNMLDKKMYKKQMVYQMLKKHLV